MSDLTKRITDALSQLLTLEIVTAVGAVEPKKPDDTNWPDLVDVANPQMIVTKINMLGGDIRTIFGEPFITGDYKSLVDYHAAREKEAFNIVQSNLAALKSLLQFARGLDTNEAGK